VLTYTPGHQIHSLTCFMTIKVSYTLLKIYGGTPEYNSELEEIYGVQLSCLQPIHDYCTIIHMLGGYSHQDRWPHTR
jgi:hypothetical protein